jgi:hypothetical protein
MAARRPQGPAARSQARSATDRAAATEEVVAQLKVIANDTTFQQAVIFECISGLAFMFLRQKDYCFVA